ncbi:putative glycosyltransferase EpsD [Fervidicola ferrireducens]|uniref:Putative glycosyltransferase EpsD n=1 Tax=Fervidicola ferrireducens TaxID=520764 RepID=A0A140LDW0_9FIRM|nr:glycosyltransferase family 4 protein [Fervidicola ferrireducens]KXG78735.1 putative glycosyltransferase EpsD [Fervidicola ferrireducens]
MKKIKLLEVVRDAEGGMKRHVEYLIRGLDKDKFDIILLLSAENLKLWNLEKSVKVANTRLGDRRALLAISKSFFDIVKILKKEKIDIIHSHGLLAAAIGTAAALVAGTPRIVTTLHNFPKNNFQNRLAGYFLRYNHKIITVSQKMAQEVREVFSIPVEKLAVIYNGIDLKSLGKFNISTFKRENSFSFLNIARLIPEKGVDVFLKASALLLEKLSSDKIDLKFYIAGTGPMEKKLKDLADELSLSGKVFFLGFCPDVYKIISESDALVLSSLSEGLSLSLLEAMAMGKPVIATDVGGNPEIVKNGISGILVPPADPKALAEAMEYIIKNPGAAEKMAINARHMVMERFSHEHMVDALQNLFSSLIFC